MVVMSIEVPLQVDSLDGLVSVSVQVSVNDNECLWRYDFGRECLNVRDCGTCATVIDAAEAIAQSLSEVGFDTTTDLVLHAYERCRKDIGE
jgi:hypothetical protein